MNLSDAEKHGNQKYVDTLKAIIEDQNKQIQNLEIKNKELTNALIKIATKERVLAAVTSPKRPQ